LNILEILAKYKTLAVETAVDYEKFNHVTLVHHSTAIEGSTLTEVETALLLTEGLTPAGKQLTFSLMAKDHLTALEFVLDEATKKSPVTVPLIQRIASLVLKHTGSVYRTPLGEVDASKGDFRRGSVHVGSSRFPNHEKVPGLMADLVKSLQGRMTNKLEVLKQLELSFNAHLQLVSIHPFYDGNGRTSRLLMNYIQRFYGLPLAIIPVEKRADYFQALIDAREQNDTTVFSKFMAQMYSRQLLKEIEQFDD